MKIKGTNKPDTLTGTPGDDTIIGKKSGDILFGGFGDDHLYGGKGNDRIYGGPGDNVLKGGKGSDTFIISDDEFDQIRDFQPGKDKIMLVTDDTWIPTGPDNINPYVAYSGDVLSYKGEPVAQVAHLDPAHDLLYF